MAFLAWGAALATIAATGIRLLIVYFIGQRLWPIRYRWAPIRRLMGAAAVVDVASEMMPATSIRTSVMLRLALFGLYLVAVWSLKIVSDADRAFVRRTVLRRATAFARPIG